MMSRVKLVLEFEPNEETQMWMVLSACRELGGAKCHQELSTSQALELVTKLASEAMNCAAGL